MIKLLTVYQSNYISIILYLVDSAEDCSVSDDDESDEEDEEEEEEDEEEVEEVPVEDVED